MFTDTSQTFKCFKYCIDNTGPLGGHNFYQRRKCIQLFIGETELNIQVFIAGFQQSGGATYTISHWCIRNVFKADF